MFNPLTMYWMIEEDENWKLMKSLYMDRINDDLPDRASTLVTSKAAEWALNKQHCSPRG